MAEQLAYKLKNLEVAPPEASWKAISGLLDAEYVPAESVLAGRLTDLEIHPPAVVWEKIDTALQTPVIPRQKPATVFRLPALKVAAAAVLLALISVSAFYIFNQNLPTAVPHDPVVFNTPEPIVPDEPLKVTELHPETPVTASAKTSRSLQQPVQANTIQYAEVHFTDELPERRYSPITDDMIHPANNRPITVDAPPIRDEQGNIIMDMRLVSADNGQYVIVTSPNGEQTRISKKFAAMLSYLNEDAIPLNFSIDGLEWKFRFQQWRDRLLEEANFIPTAANYLDILEFKNLIDEN